MSGRDESAGKWGRKLLLATVLCGFLILFIPSAIVALGGTPSPLLAVPAAVLLSAVVLAFFIDGYRVARRDGISRPRALISALSRGVKSLFDFSS